ncbi:MAG: hypothetical protein P4N59_25675 [Negativicutes bacterium]|nr:hypothetical protein [Negativicutes bacterium]
MLQLLEVILFAMEEQLQQVKAAVWLEELEGQMAVLDLVLRQPELEDLAEDVFLALVVLVLFKWVEVFRLALDRGMVLEAVEGMVLAAEAALQEWY